MFRFSLEMQSAVLVDQNDQQHQFEIENPKAKGKL